MANTIGDTLQGSIFRVKSALQGVSIALVKQFGPVMKRTLEQFARWLNRMVDSEEKLEKFWKGVKTATKFLLAFAIGLPIVRRGIKFFAAETVGAAGSMTLLGGAVTGLKFALRGLKIAIASTGIGLLIVGLGELAAGFFFAETEGERLAGMIDEQGRTIVDIIDKKKALAKMEDSVANNVSKEIIQVDRLTKAYKKAETPMEDRAKILNKLKKISEEHFGELEIGIENYEDLDVAAEAYKDTIMELAKVEAAKQAVVDVEGTILSLRASQKNNNQDVKEYYNFLRHYWKTQWGMGEAFNMEKARIFSKSINHRTMDTSKESKGTQYENIYPLDYMEKGEEALSKINLYTKELKEAKELREFIESEIANVDLSLLLDLGDEGGPGSCGDDERWSESAGRCVKKSTAAKYSMSEKVAEQQSDVPSIDDQLAYNIAMLEAKGRGILAFKNQEKTTKDEKDTADIAYNKNVLALNKARYAEELRDLTYAKDAEKLLLQSDAEFNLLSKEEQNLQLLAIDEQFEIDKKDAAERNKQQVNDIENKIAQQELERAKLERDAKVDLLDEQYETDQLNLDEALANKEITEMEHQQFMLMLEAAYLLQKHELYAGYGEEQKNINKELKRNTIETTEAQIAAMNDYISSVGDLGQQMQDLAGDEEKLSGLRKVGVVVTKAAATAEKILAIATTINTLATKKKTIADVIDVAMTGKVIAANLKKTISNISTAASGFIATVSSAAKSIPFPLNLLAIGATYMAIKGVVRSIKSSFGGGGVGDMPSDSGGSSSGGSRGGGRSSSGAMSYYTYGGQHSTYADGGMVYGNSHAQGGEKFAVGGRVVELEGGEAVINKRSTSMFRSQLSAMNTAGGGVKFADGGVTNNPSFAQTQFDVTNQSSNRGSSRVVVVEADITSTQNTIKTIEAEASF